MLSGIYLITCNENGRRYVGSSKDIERRVRSHCQDLSKNRHDNRHLQRAWNKYGSAAFCFSVLEFVNDHSRLTEREQYWMDDLNPEFNITPYAGRPTTEGLERTEQWLSNMSKGIKRYWENISDEEREERRIKASSPHSEETKRVLSQRTRKAYAEGRLPRKRRPRTEEEKANILAGMENHLSQKRAAAAARRVKWEAGREEREMQRREKISRALTGKTVLEETKEKLRQAATKQMADPIVQEKHRQAVLEAMQRPDVKEALANRPKQVFTQEHRDNIGRAHKGRKVSPETIELMRQRRREWWARKKAESAKSI